MTAGDRDLAAVVRAYEQRGVPALEDVVARRAPDEAWLEELVAGVSVPATSVAATWLLKAYLERGLDLSRGLTADLLRRLADVGEDDARLHLCQLVRRLEIPRRNAGQLARFLADCAEGQHKFTRAWAVDAWQRLAEAVPEHRAEARRRLRDALSDPAASVRARARNIERELGF